MAAARAHRALERRVRSAPDVADALLLDPETVRTYFKRYQQGGIVELLSMSYVGEDHCQWHYRPAAAVGLSLQEAAALLVLKKCMVRPGGASVECAMVRTDCVNVSGL